VTLAPLGFDLVGLIGISDRFTSLAVEWIAEGLSSSDAVALEQAAAAGLGEALALAYYKAMVLLPEQPALMEAVTDLQLQYRFRCALDGIDDQRGQAFWLQNGLDRELQESECLHATAQLALSRQMEWLCFGRHLAGYFGVAPESSDQPAAAEQPEALISLEPVGGHLWHVRQAGGPKGDGREAYLLVPHPCIGIVAVRRLCELIAELLPQLMRWQPASEAALCLPLGTRKVSISKQGVHSCSTYFDGAKPVPFSLNRGMDAYLVLTHGPLASSTQLRSQRLCFAPLLDSLSTLVFRDPFDYRLGDGAFLHQPLTLPARRSLFSPSLGAAARLPTAPGQCLVEGLLLNTRESTLSLTPCHDLADRYARRQGLSGHGPSGVMNQSVLISDRGVLATWRYERNFDSWSGRSADVARHPSLNFLAWERRDSGGAGLESSWEVTPLTYSGYPSECKVEDLRLFSVQGRIYAISALILSRSRYSAWMPELSTEAAANNTIDDMVVVQAIGELDPERADLRFMHLPVLHCPADPEAPASPLPAGFEKNWLIHPQGDAVLLLYSVQPWRLFSSDRHLQHWQLSHQHSLALPDSIEGPLRNSAHPFPLHDRNGSRGLGLVVHRRRRHSYRYDQYLMVLSEDTLKPLKISRTPVLSVNAGALDRDLGFRKNSGVCYVSSVVVHGERVSFLFNLFDCRTCVLEVAMGELVSLIDDPAAFASLVP
jgi:hypothetical protein